MKVILKILIFILLVGCGSLKKSTKSQLKEESRTEEISKESVVFENVTDIASKDIAKIENRVEQVEQALEDFHARKLVYDTSKPVSDLTGKPPIISELEISSRKSADKKLEGTERKQSLSEGSIVDKTDFKSEKTLRRDSVGSKEEESKVIVEKKDLSGCYIFLGSFLLLILYIYRTQILRFIVLLFHQK